MMISVPIKDLLNVDAVNLNIKPYAVLLKPAQLPEAIHQAGGFRMSKESVFGLTNQIIEATSNYETLFQKSIRTPNGERTISAQSYIDPTGLGWLKVRFVASDLKERPTKLVADALEAPTMLDCCSVERSFRVTDYTGMISIYETFEPIFATLELKYNSNVVRKSLCNDTFLDSSKAHKDASIVVMQDEHTVCRAFVTPWRMPKNDPRSV